MVVGISQTRAGMHEAPPAGSRTVPVQFAPPLAVRYPTPWPGTGEVHVWRARAEVVTVLLDDGGLSADELRRAERLRIPDRRKEFVFAHRLLRHILSLYLARSPAELAFERGEHGKPTTGGSIQFNLTHCGSAVLLAISVRTAVGIDLEDCTRKTDCESLAAVCLNQIDQHRFQTLFPDQRQACLLQWWTRKEAVLKAQGCGLMRDPRDLAVCWPGTPFALQSVVDQGRRWDVADLRLGDRWRAAVAMEGPLYRLHGFCLGW
jgi:4'-phosphopantetheinyl transferase